MTLTDYPSSGSVHVTVEPMDSETVSFPLYLRVPGCYEQFKAEVAGETFIGSAGA